MYAERTTAYLQLISADFTADIADYTNAEEVAFPLKYDPMMYVNPAKKLKREETAEGIIFKDTILSDFNISITPGGVFISSVHIAALFVMCTSDDNCNIDENAMSEYGLLFAKYDPKFLECNLHLPFDFMYLSRHIPIDHITPAISDKLHWLTITWNIKSYEQLRDLTLPCKWSMLSGSLPLNDIITYKAPWIWSIVCSRSDLTPQIVFENKHLPWDLDQLARNSHFVANLPQNLVVDLLRARIAE